MVHIIKRHLEVQFLENAPLFLSLEFVPTHLTLQISICSCNDLEGNGFRTIT